MPSQYGVLLPNGCRIIHEQAANSKSPFPQMIPDLTMHEFDPGTATSPNTGPPSGEEPVVDTVLKKKKKKKKKKTQSSNDSGTTTTYSGQFGLIPFNASLRLPRHVHIEISTDEPSTRKFVTERILVLNGVALVELNGQVFVVAPNTVVVIAPGVPHTWTACPAGVRLPVDGVQSHGGEHEKVVSTGEFLMVYEYEEPTGFFPTEQTDSLYDVRDYVKYEGDLQRIRFPQWTVDDVLRKGSIVLGDQVLHMTDLFSI